MAELAGQTIFTTESTEGGKRERLGDKETGCGHLTESAEFKSRAFGRLMPGLEGGSFGTLMCADRNSGRLVQRLARISGD
jgi:hypothetical protein